MNILKKPVAFFMLFALAAVAFSQETKNALLIANSEYGGDMRSLAQPVPEARELKAALESIGFEVTLEVNADRETMDAAFRQFKEKTEKTGGIAFFHYGGHAVQVNGVNYLIPAHTKIEDESKVRYRCVELDEIMVSMSGKYNIVILDSCRDNPFGNSRGRETRGLAAVNKRPRNKSIIIYSAESGQKAEDGIFTPVLTKEIIKKDKTIDDIFKEVTKKVQEKTKNKPIPQRPAAYTQLDDDIFLAGRSSSVKTLTGSIRINSEFAGTVFLDGENKGSIKEDGSILIEELRTGSCAIEVRSNTNTFKKKVKISAGDTVVVNIKTGSITLSSEVSGDVYLNGKYFGTVNRFIPIVLSKLLGGNYQVEVRTESQTFKKEVKVDGGETSTVSIYKQEAPAATTQPEPKEDSTSDNWFYAPGLSIGYSFSHLTVSNIASFNAHGLDLKLEPARFTRGYLDIKILYFVYSYAHTVIDSGNYEKTEKIDYHEFNFVPLKLGSNLGWFSFHVGAGLLLLWEKAAHLNLTQYESPSPKIGAVIPIDIGVNFTDFIGIYAEYKPAIIPIQSLEPFVKHSLNIGLSFYIPIYF